MMGIRKLFSVILIFLLFIIPLISAYNGWGGYWRSPLDLLENEWVRFVAVFILFFAIVFVAMSRSFKEHLGAAMAVALAVSFFITMAVARRGWLYSYAGDEIGDYLIIFALILGALLLIKAVMSIIGGLGFFLVLFGISFILRNIDFYENLPLEILSYDLWPLYEFLSGNGFLFTLIVIFIVVLIAAYAKDDRINKKIRRWLWGKKKKTFRELWED